MSKSAKKSDVDKMFGRVQNNLVSALLADSSSLNEVLSIVDADDFTIPACHVIVGTMARLLRSNEQVSVETVANQITMDGNLNKVNITTLFDMFSRGDRALVLSSPVGYAYAVRELSAKHRISVLLDDSQEWFSGDSGVDAVSAIANVQSQLNDERLRLSDDKSIIDVADVSGKYLEVIEERRAKSEANKENAEGLQGIPTGIPSLNKYTSGFMPQQMITVGARSGVGKSIFGIMQAVSSARAGLSVLLFSLEMSEQEIVDRIVANLSGVSLSRLKNGYLTNDDLERVKRAQSVLSGMHIQIDTDARATVDSIRSRCIKEAQSERGLDIVIVDYLQLITPTGKFGSRQEQVADLSRNMKLLAKSLSIPVVVLSQLNRQKATEDGETPIPTIDNIRESAALGQDSDIVILLHRDNNVDNTTPHTTIILEKNRNGVSHKHILCYSNLECSNFREIVREKDLDDMSDDIVSDDDIDTLSADDDVDDFVGGDDDVFDDFSWG